MTFTPPNDAARCKCLAYKADDPIPCCLDRKRERESGSAINEVVRARRRLVIVESPYKSKLTDPVKRKEELALNIAYARAAIRDCLMRGESPFASHLLYTQDGVLDDDVQDERQHGIDAGLAWGAVADATVVYIDRGMSSGMTYGVMNAAKAGRPIEFRMLPGPHRIIVDDAVKPVTFRDFSCAGADPRFAAGGSVGGSVGGGGYAGVDIAIGNSGGVLCGASGGRLDVV